MLKNNKKWLINGAEYIIMAYAPKVEVWLSRLERSLHMREVAGSNPAISTKIKG